MPSFVDFHKIKAVVRIAELIPLLGLEMVQRGDQYRAACPACRSSDDRSLVITAGKEAFYCHSAQKGGDLISLWSHIRGIGVRDAAVEIVEAIGTVPEQGTSSTVPYSKSRATVPQNQKGRDNGPKFDPDAFLQKLAYTEDMKDIASEAEAEAFRIGVHRGQLHIPAVYESGAIAGWWKLIDGKLVPPKEWLPDRSNVVQLKKPA